MNMPWIPAPEATADFGLKPYIGCLAFIIVGGYHPQVPTRYDERASALRIAFIPLDGPEAGHIIPDALVFNSRIVRRGRGSAGQVILGRIVIEPADRGNEPYELNPPTDADNALAMSWNNAFPGKLAELTASIVSIYQAEERRLANPSQPRQPNQGPQQGQAQQSNQPGNWNPPPNQPSPVPNNPPQWQQPNQGQPQQSNQPGNWNPNQPQSNQPGNWNPNQQQPNQPPQWTPNGNQGQPQNTGQWQSPTLASANPAQSGWSPPPSNANPGY
jgi:hypothetical protein